MIGTLFTPFAPLRACHPTTNRNGICVMRGWCAVLMLALFTRSAGAHPIPKYQHDRGIQVRLTAAGIIVDYRLDVDEFTAIFADVPAVLSKEQLAKLRSPQEFYDAFLSGYAPILADNLIAKSDDQHPLNLRCTSKRRQSRDDNGLELDHLRFDFRFEATWPDDGSGRHKLTFRDGTYELEEGQVRLAVQIDKPLVLIEKAEPDKALQVRNPKDLGPGDDARRRSLNIVFDLPVAERATASTAAEEEPPSNESGHGGWLDRVLDSRQGLAMLLVLMVGFGAAHALTPGHGKTLVAAYLVGERGTSWHALILGLVTTATHTGAVIALTLGLILAYGNTTPTLHVQNGLRLGGGVLVAGLGFWLLLRRLAGQPDHVHFGGHGHHHHHHGFADHTHDLHGHAIPVAKSDQGGPSVVQLVLLGIAGGIVPCSDAILVFGGAVSTGRSLWLALYLLLAFSAGLAGVLIVTGMLVVRVKSFAASRWEKSRLFQTLPVISALSVTAVGLWLCYDTIHHSIGS